MVKCLPFPTVLIVHVTSLLFLPAASIPFSLKMDFPILWLPLGLLIFLWLSGLCVLVLSLTIWWNRPLRINEEGIACKGGQIHRWCDAVGFSTKKGPPTQYGPLYYVVIINYSDGSALRFEKSPSIIKSVRTYCQDETFLIQFNSSGKQLN